MYYVEFSAFARESQRGFEMIIYIFLNIETVGSESQAEVTGVCVRGMACLQRVCDK